VPASLKVFLAALAIIDDLGAVLVIALFYTSGISVPDLLGAAAVTAALVLMGRRGVQSLTPYMLLGLMLWILVYRSGVHATLAEVILALTIPIRTTPGRPEASPDASPLHRLEHALHKPVAFLIVPIFGFANAGVSFEGVSLATFAQPVTLGVGLGLVLGKLVGIFGAVVIMVRTGLADLPAAASWSQVLGVSLLCGIGFTMSLFIGLLAFSDPAYQDQVKFGILSGSLVAGIMGYLILRMAEREVVRSVTR
jgi:NhaA family Na+:H+ antiporter